mgnify:CR=1 FL=1
MKLSILARLIISYLVILSMLAGVSLFFIFQFGRFNQVVRTILLSDTAVLEFSNRLSDALLSEVRYNRKYAVLNNEQLHENYLQAEADFDRLLEKAGAEAELADTGNLLRKIEARHQDLGRLVREERELIRQAQPYSFETYAGQKKEHADAIIGLLKMARQASEKNVFTKIRELSAFSDRAGNVSIFIAVVSLFTCLVVAVFITRGITRPLNVIKAKTRKISEGDFSGDLELQSPPTISELAGAINDMCHRLEEVDEMKANFFSHMSHELRTPLASIKEGSSMLLDGLGGEISEKQERILSIIGQESDRMITLVNSLLDLSKMEAGMTAYHFTPTDLAGMVRNCLQGLLPLAAAKSIEIDNTIEDLPPVKVDRERVQLVFLNLVGNALKFTGNNGRITLEAKVKDKFVEVAVRDTGIGIPAKELEKIFLKFRQVIPATANMAKGTGLGLAIAKQIILAHGGMMWAVSSEGQGSTFYFTLPLAE